MGLLIFALILTGLNFLALLAVLLSLASIRRELRLLSAGVAKSNRYLRQILKEDEATMAGEEAALLMYEQHLKRQATEEESKE